MKRKDELKEIRGWSSEQRVEKLQHAENELMGLRFKHASGQLKITSQISQLKKRIGRIHVIISEQVSS